MSIAIPTIPKREMPLPGINGESLTDIDDLMLVPIGSQWVCGVISSVHPVTVCWGDVTVHVPYGTGYVGKKSVIAAGAGVLIGKVFDSVEKAREAIAPFRLLGSVGA